MADWEALRTFATTNQATRILGWMDGNDLRVRRQIAYRQRPFGHHPRSNSPAEYVINSIDRKLSRRRRFRFRNARRLQMILNLMRADFAGQAGAVEYAAMVKRHLERLNWRFAPDWTANEDDPTELRSLSRLLLETRKHRQAEVTAYMADAKLRSVLGRIAEDNMERASFGYPALEFEMKPGQRTVSVTVAGMMLSDFPEITRDWDYARNTLDPLTLTAGCDTVVQWKCHRCGHEWPAEVGQRTKRRTRCSACSTPWATAATSLAAQRPDLPRSGMRRRTCRARRSASRSPRRSWWSGVARSSRPTTPPTACRPRRARRSPSVARSVARWRRRRPCLHQCSLLSRTCSSHAAALPLRSAPFDGLDDDRLFALRSDLSRARSRLWIMGMHPQDDGDGHLPA